jgi:hypothetical protein
MTASRQYFDIFLAAGARNSVAVVRYEQQCWYTDVKLLLANGWPVLPIFQRSNTGAYCSREASSFIDP